jgi:hypothetical protein
MRLMTAIVCVLLPAACAPAGSSTDGGMAADSGVADGGGVDACHEFTLDELFAIESAVMDAAAAVAATLDKCSFDSDCMNADIRTGCVRGCCVPINRFNEETYRNAEKAIEVKHCTAATDGCGVPVNNADCWCIESQCVAGHCVNASTPGLHRVMVDGTNGFCDSYGQADTTCADVEDCVAYRIPVPAECCTGITAEPDCMFANKNSLGSGQPECAADKACDAYPRDCVNDRCMFTIPKRGCGSATDCTKVDTECGCMAASVTADTSGLIFGTECDGSVPCAEADVRCVEGTCRLVGTFMDATIALFCKTAADCGFLGLGETSAAECEEMFKKDNYEGAASRWLLISAADAVGTNCGVAGPWGNMATCAVVICP